MPIFICKDKYLSELNRARLRNKTANALKSKKKKRERELSRATVIP